MSAADLPEHTMSAIKASAWSVPHSFPALCKALALRVALGHVTKDIIISLDFVFLITMGPP